MSEQIKNIILERLKEMGCKDIVLEETNQELIVARFNCEELTSFNERLDGWTQLGIELNDKEGHDYRIIFIKLNHGSLSSDSIPLNKNVFLPQ